MSLFIRNVIFHCYAPHGTLSWLGNIMALREYASQFNGRRVAAIVTGDGLHAPEDVQRHFGDGWEFLLVPNDPVRREGATLRLLLEAVADPNPGQVLFRCHSKGASLHRNEEFSARWRDTMYRACLADSGGVDRALLGSAVAGAYRRRYSPGPQEARRRGHGVPWIFAGAFWWARHDRLFQDARWQALDYDNPYVPEALPGALFDYEESACLYGEGWPDGLNLSVPLSYGPYLDR